MRQQERHLEKGQWILARPGQLIPHVGVGGCGRSPGYEFRRPARNRAASRGDAAGEHVEKEQAPRGHPAVQIAGRGCPPVVRREGASRLRDERRRSATMTLAPDLLPSMMRCAWGLK